MIKYIVIAAIFMMILLNCVIAQEEIPDTLVSLEAVEIIGHKATEEAWPVEILDRESLELLPLKDVGNSLKQITNVGGVRKGGAVLDPVIRGFK